MKELILLALFLVFGLAACSVKTANVAQAPLSSETQQCLAQATTVSDPLVEFGIEEAVKPLADIKTIGGSIPVYHAATLPLVQDIKKSSPQTLEEIDKIGVILQKNPDYKATIEGHTWNIGNAKSNKEISKTSADSVKKRLIDTRRIAAERIVAIGYGSQNPIATNETEEGRQTNRRVQVIITGPAKKIEVVAAPLVAPKEPDNVQAKPEGSDLMDCTAHFESGTAILQADFQEKIHEVGMLFQQHPDATIIIEGHTDNEGQAENNATLSQDRADVVKNILHQVYSIPNERIIALGYGQEKPLATNETSDGREKNRRVVIVATTKAERIQVAMQRLVQPKTQPQEQSGLNDLAAAQRPATPGKALVLCYHRFDENKPFSVSIEYFEKQIKYMLDNGYNIVSPETLASYIKQKNIPDKTVLITIDDGWRSSMRAFRVLKKFDVPFTLFLAMQYVGAVGSSCLSMEDISELKTYSKVTFGNHSYGHSTRLAQAGSEQSAAFIRNDVKKSVERFKEVFGTETKFFAYPFGMSSDTYVRALREVGMEYMFTVNPKLVGKDADLAYLPRVGGHDFRIETLVTLFKSPDKTPEAQLALAGPLPKKASTGHVAVRKAEYAASQKTDAAAQPKSAEIVVALKQDSPAVQKAEVVHTPLKPDAESKNPDSFLPRALQPHSQLTAPLKLPLAGKAVPSSQMQAATVANNADTLNDARPSRFAQRYTPQHIWTPETASVPAPDKSVAAVPHVVVSAVPAPTLKTEPVAPQIKAPAPAALSSGGLDDTISITAVGDIMMGTTFPRNLLPPDDGAHSFDNVKSHFSGADILFGNLEGPLTDAGSPSKCGGSGNCYEFKMPSRYVAHLKRAGFTVLNIANNHANDFGALGAMNTVATLQENNIAPVGGDFVATLNIRGKKVAMLGFAHNRKKNSHAITDIPAATQLVKKLKAENDLVVVSFHGGAEGAAAVNISDKTEVFCGENRGNVIQFAHAVVDAGADMVLGHGPHVLRAMEVYKGKLIAYSLGNFLVYETFGTNGPCGQSVILKAKLDAKTGNFVAGDIVPVKISQVGLPSIDTNGGAIKQIKLLTLNNLPQATLAISDAGKLAAPQAVVAKGATAELLTR